MSVTSTETVIAASNNNSIRSLGASIDSLSSPRQRNSQVSKVYKKASTLFLTREFAEAFSTLQPVLTLPERSREDAAADDDEEDEEPERLAPIATASRSSRVKVWSLYLTLLNTIIELGPEEGKAALGSKQWRDIATNVRNGTIWDEVVRIGYRGIEGHVDADVVTNLATLLLSHSISQSTNQEHLETYLATSDHPHAPPAPSSKSKDSFATPTNSPKNSYRESWPPTTNGATNTPHALASRLKILELYILHVLPANSQWEYARDFIQINDTLDDERKELFSHALEALEAEKTDGNPNKEASKKTESLSSSQDLQHAEPRPIEEHDPHEQHHRRPNSEHDYGIIDEEQAVAGSTNLSNNKKSPPSVLSKPSTRTTNPSHNRPTNPTPSKPSPSKTSPTKKQPPNNTNTGILHHSKALLSLFQNLILNISSSVSANPLALLRLVLFVVALVVALGRRDVRERVGRMWEKVRGTVGMGVRVSYI